MIPDKVHLVGSIALDSVEEVFRTVGGVLGRRVRRVPDGEPGGRRLWISWQYPLFRAQPFLKADVASPSPVSGFLPMLLADNVDPAQIRFPELGYAREGRASYQDFLAARRRGELPAGVRFQVSLPTPFAVVHAFCPKAYAALEGPYEKAMLGEVERLCEAIPHADLCIQWDVCLEMIMWDDRAPFMRTPLPDFPSEFAQRVKRLSAAVPKDVECGFHLCYGDWEAKHFIEPLDAGKLVEVANAITAASSRPVTYVHMPVPINRSDDAYFEPLRQLRLSPGTELYLGVVAADGVEGTKKRIATASKYVSDFGIATECGMARCKTPEVVRTLLKTHAESSREPEAASARHAAHPR